MPSKEMLPSKPCTIETIDTGFVEYLQDEFNVHVFTNSGFRKVPVIWVGSERAYQTKADASLRDTSGKLILPIITVERTSMQKDPAFKGAVQADIIPNPNGPRAYRGGAFKIATKINQEKTAALQNARNAGEYGPNQAFRRDYSTQVVLDEYLVPVPVYMAITYSVILRCEYQQQMNQMVLPFITKPGQLNHFVFTKDGHRFESFIQQDFAGSNNLSNMSEEERKFQTKIDIKVLGYLIGQGSNEARPKVVKRETIAKLSTPIESVLQAVPSNTNSNTDSDAVEIGGKCYIKKRIVSISAEDGTATQASTGAGGAFSNDDEPTSITDLINNVKKGKETSFRLGEVQLNTTITDELVASEDDDC